jgi:hypothetical protein
MLGIFLVIVSCIGLLLSWPMLHGALGWFTAPVGGAALTAIGGEFAAAGYSRPDGIFLAVFAIAMIATLFISTKPWLIVARSLALSIVTALLGAELAAALMANSPRPPAYSLVGLGFTVCFLIAAFLASTLKLGSNRSLVSTLGGAPMSESQTLAQGVKSTLQMARTQLTVRLTALDQISSDFPSGKTIELAGPEVNLGRDDGGWAHLRIGARWPQVSRKHLTLLQAAGNMLLAQPVARSYSYAINGKPHTMPSEIPSGAELSLVSGAGPRFKVEYTARQLPALSSHAIAGASRVAAEEFKRMQRTMMIFVLLALLGLPLSGTAIFWERQEREEARAEQQRKLEAKQKELAGAREELSKAAAKAEQANKDLQALETAKRQKEVALKEMQERQAALIAEKTATLREKEALQSEIEVARQKIQDLQSEVAKARESGDIQSFMKKADDLAKKLDALLRPEDDFGVVFPVMSVEGVDSKHVNVGSGSGFLFRDSQGRCFFATAVHVIPENGDTLVAIGIRPPWTREAQQFAEKYESIWEDNMNKPESIAKKAADAGILVLPAKDWERTIVADGDGLAYVEISGDLKKTVLKRALPVSALSEPNEAIGIFGYPAYGEGEKAAPVASYSVGVVVSVEEETLLIRGASMGGFSGSPVLTLGVNGGQASVVGVLAGSTAMQGPNIPTTESLTFAYPIPGKFR